MTSETNKVNELKQNKQRAEENKKNWNIAVNGLKNVGLLNSNNKSRFKGMSDAGGGGDDKPKNEEENKKNNDFRLNDNGNEDSEQENIFPEEEKGEIITPNSGLPRDFIGNKAKQQDVGVKL